MGDILDEMTKPELKRFIRESFYFNTHPPKKALFCLGGGKKESENYLKCAKPTLNTESLLTGKSEI